MKRLLTAAAFVLMASHAQAADKLPQAFVGQWCATAENTYQHIPCDHPGRLLTIRHNGFVTLAMKCTVHAVNANRKGDHLATFACTENGGKATIANYWISRDGSNLLMNETERSN